MRVRFLISSAFLAVVLPVLAGCARGEPGEGGAPAAASGQSEIREMARYIQKKMASCWRLEPGARAPDEPVVEIRVSLDPDGALRSAEIVDTERFERDSRFRSAAETAKRALFECQPFDLPPEHYEIWRNMSLGFHPSPARP